MKYFKYSHKKNLRNAKDIKNDIEFNYFISFNVPR